MARLESKVLFLTTSPRTPAKMIPEIALLCDHFSGEKWNEQVQTSFMHLLKEENFYNGLGENDPAFSARDRINRGPQSLGFVCLKPCVSLTPAGKVLTTSERTDEIFLRQLLKFQLPSPYHVLSEKGAKFNVKPYLEIFRLIRHFGSLSFDELKIFGLQLTDYRKFPAIVRKIEHFRNAKSQHGGSYRQFVGEYFEKELRAIYATELKSGRTKTRESDRNDVTDFLHTKGRNMRDYADACCRYLRATGMVNVSHIGGALSIVPQRVEDVDYFLSHVPRKPLSTNDLPSYVEYLGNLELPKLLTDDKKRLVSKIRATFPEIIFRESDDIHTLKNLYSELLEQRKSESIVSHIKALKSYSEYDDIQEKYEQIVGKKLYDAPLMMEWNTWRAMTMLDGGDIRANLKFDDFGKPLSTALGNMPDIFCDYGDFLLNVEVTLSSGQLQYEMEGEPVARHVGKIKRDFNKPTYCLFIAPTINPACVAHFFILHKTNLSFYGGRLSIIPMTLKVFQKMVEDSFKASYVPSPENIQKLFSVSDAIAQDADNELDWYDKVTEKAINWLSL